MHIGIKVDVRWSRLSFHRECNAISGIAYSAASELRRSEQDILSIDG